MTSFSKIPWWLRPSPTQLEVAHPISLWFIPWSVLFSPDLRCDPQLTISLKGRICATLQLLTPFATMMLLWKSLLSWDAAWLSICPRDRKKYVEKRTCGIWVRNQGGRQTLGPNLNPPPSQARHSAVPAPDPCTTYWQIFETGGYKTSSL